MQTFVFGVDIDSVLAELRRPVLEILNERFGTSFGLEDPISQSGEGWLEGEEIVDFYYSLFRNELFLIKALPITGCRDGVCYLRQMGEVHIITARLPTLRTATVDWLETHGIQFDQLTFADDKVGAASHAGITHFLEDTPEQALALADAGVKVFLFDYPWNRGLTHGLIHRVYGWSDLIEELKNT